MKNSQAGCEKRPLDPRINPNPVLPKYYYQALHLKDAKKYSDKDWIIEQLNIINRACRQRVCEKYSRLYKEAYDAEPIEYKKDNKARFVANTYLLEFRETQVNEQKSSIYMPSPDSWEIMSHLTIYPETILLHPHWHGRYLEFAIRKKPELVWDIEYMEDIDEDFIRIALTVKSSMMNDLKKLNESWYEWVIDKFPGLIMT